VAVLAIDWSGRATGAHHSIWTAEAVRGELVGLEAGRTRNEIADYVLDRAEHDPALIVGFDFSFSLPAWFLDECGYQSAPALWDAATEAGEGWLRDCADPFWGRRGRGRPDLPEHLRATERAVAAVGGIRPKSTFQIGGAGSVGTGSVRGFPVLSRLQRAGFAIWPFDEPAQPPVAIEIYPRVLTGVVVKSSPTARRAYLDARLPELAPSFREVASSNENAFDAAVSAVVMSSHTCELVALPAVDDPVMRREGSVWTPTGERDAELRGGERGP
jgi:hypothetical protein